MYFIITMMDSHTLTFSVVLLIIGFLLNCCSSEPVIPCPSGLHLNGSFCYFVEQTTFPYNCPYKDVVSHGTLSNREEGVWLFVKRNIDYGYYEYLDPISSYQIYQVPNSQVSVYDCIVINRVPKTENCSKINEAQCGYSRGPNRGRDYCKAYSEICETTETCWCNPAESHQHTCQIDCAINKEVTCDKCREKFKQYPKAQIQLKIVGNTTIRVTVKYPMKLATLAHTDSDLQCFTDAQSPKESSIYAKIIPQKVSSNKDQKVFDVDLNLVGLNVGCYWCEAYLYPDLEKVVSNTVVAGASEYSLCFVINITVPTNIYYLLPYTVHTSAAYLLYTTVNRRGVISLVKIFPIINNEYIKMEFRLSVSAKLTVTQQIDLHNEYSELRKMMQNLTDEIRNCAVCIRNITYWNGQRIDWPDTTIGRTVPPNALLVQGNGLPVTRTCLGTFTYGAYWSEVSQLTNLGSASHLTEELYNLVNSNKTAEEKNQHLEEILNDISSIVPYDVYLIAVILEQIAQSQDEFDLARFVSNLNIVVGMNSKILSKAQEALNATDMILYSLDIALGRHASSSVKNIESEYVLGQTVDLRSTEINGLAIYSKRGKFVVENLENVRTIADLNFEGLKFALFLPPKLMDCIINQTVVYTNRLVTTMFRIDTLFNGDEDLSNFGSVVGVYVSNFISTVLPEPLPVVFRRGGSMKFNDAYCGHWLYGVDDMQVSIFGRWVADGLPLDIKQDYILCYYDHMTHFALLMGAPDDEVLNIVSIAGCVLSFVGVSVILITGLMFKNWRRSVSVKLLLNFSCALLGQMVFLFISSFAKYDERNWLCSVVAVGLHYFVISQFFWMFTITYLQYKKFVDSLAGETKHPLLKACLLGWVFPIFPVTTIFIIDASSYDYNCYLTGLYLQLAVLLPVVCIIAINVIMFMRIFFALLGNKAKAYGQKDRMVLVKIKWGVVLYFLTGFSWVFGLLANFLDSMILSYVFCVTSTIQGLVLGICFCMFNESVKEMWLKKMCCRTESQKQTSSIQSKLTN